MNRGHQSREGSGEKRKRIVISECEVIPVDAHGFGSGVRGLVTITLNNAIVLRSIRIIKDREGKLSVAYPAQQGRDKTWYNLVEIKSESLREEISSHVLAEYQRVVRELEAAAEASESPESRDSLELRETPEAAPAQSGETSDLSASP